jgi:HD-GYP domain-containing protein (c-di-GMP phosphodiesterase class II)
MAIIAEGRGTHFDPDVYDAFMDALPDIVEIRDKFHHATGMAPIHEIMIRIEHAMLRQATA